MPTLGTELLEKGHFEGFQGLAEAHRVDGKATLVDTVNSLVGDLKKFSGDANFIVRSGLVMDVTGGTSSNTNVEVPAGYGAMVLNFHVVAKAGTGGAGDSVKLVKFDGSEKDISDALDFNGVADKTIVAAQALDDANWFVNSGELIRVKATHATGLPDFRAFVDVMLILL